MAGQQALPRRPPLIAERCLRTQFISPMVAPDLSRALLIDCLSARVMPAAGRAGRADSRRGQEDHTVVFGQVADQFEYPFRHRQTGRVRHRVRGFDHFDFSQRHRDRNGSPPDRTLHPARQRSTTWAMAAAALPAPITVAPDRCGRRADGLRGRAADGPRR